MRQRSLDLLDARFFARACEFLARAAAAGIPLVVVETLRSAADHAADVAAGRSWISHSKHEVGLALDVCPYLTFQLHGANKLQWDANDPVWEQLAKIAESLGLVSGFRWKVRDCGHVELPTA